MADEKMDGTTPRPEWVMLPQCGTFSDGTALHFVRVEYKPVDSRILGPFTKDEAILIVRCFNSHDALVEALNRAHAALSRLEEDEYVGVPGDLVHDIAAALALATKEAP